MVEKFGHKDAKNGNFNNQMGFRKKSILFLITHIHNCYSTDYDNNLLENQCFHVTRSDCFSKDLEKVLSSEYLAQIDGKIYLSPSILNITSTGLYLNIDEDLFPIKGISCDENGIFLTSINLAYTPWHDEDWQCERCGRWSPRYESKCVSCGTAKPRNPRKWGS